MDKIKNAVCFVPACLFLYFGGETIYSSFIELVYEPTILAEEYTNSLWPFIVRESVKLNNFLGIHHQHWYRIGYSI